MTRIMSSLVRTPAALWVVTATLINSLPSASLHAGAVSEGPGFDCRFAKSSVELLICNTPELADLDRQLVELFDNTRYQGGINAKALHKDEDRWLKEERNVCSDVTCIKRAYVRRINHLREQSLRAASPAAYDETRPFPTLTVSMDQIKAFVGKPCDVVPDIGRSHGDLQRIEGFLPIITAKATVYPVQTHGDRFAFLTVTAGDGPCRIADIVALPSASVANAFLQCDLHMPDITTFPGVGMRRAGESKIVAYWTIEGDRQQFRREPLGVLAAEDSLRCQQPESGE